MTRQLTKIGLSYANLAKVKDQLVLKDEVLMIVDEDGILRIVVPAKLTKMVLQLHHDIPSAGHLDFEKTYAAIKGKFF